MLTSNRIVSSFDPLGFWHQFYGDLNDVWPVRQVAAEMPLNLWTSAEGAELNAELPGRELDDVQVSVHRDVVSIEARATASESPETATAVRQERVHPQISRQVRLPFEIDPDRVQASYERGVLRIMLQRHQSTMPSKVTVKAG
ncbi:MAG: Hsp20/alpha crystallin family protein [Planctomycetaceae bacterium]